ncbi:MAG: hypothetical protein M3Y08_03400 [Fibrobacterota bacterium]|nr:hypothetical protein [Fibrobacterota bacterium]
MDDLVSHAVKEGTQKLLQAKGAGESVVLDDGDAALSALFGIDLHAAGEKWVPAEPGNHVRIPPPPNKPGRRIPTKKNTRAMKNQKAIEDALSALEILSGEISGLESDLGSPLK